MSGEVGLRRNKENRKRSTPNVVDSSKPKRRKTNLESSTIHSASSAKTTEVEDTSLEAKRSSNAERDT